MVSKSGIFRSLRNGNYRLYAIGALISNVGTWMQITAIGWLILQITGSGTALGIAVAVQLLPTMVLSPLGGALADRYPKWRLLLLAQVLMAIPSAALGILSIVGVGEVWVVYLLMLLFGVGRALEGPARQSFVAEMVEQIDLANAVSLNSASYNVGRLVGPAAAGLLVAALGAGVAGAGWVILINAFSYIAAIVVLLAMDQSRLHPSLPATQIFRHPGAALRYVATRPDLLMVLTCALFIGAFGMNFTVTTALMSTTEFAQGATQFGLLGSLIAIGSLAGALIAAGRVRPRLSLILGSAIAFGVFQAVSAAMPTYLAYALILPFVGLAVLTFGTSAAAMVQLTVEPFMRGRIGAMLLMAFLGSIPIGAPVIGWIGQEFGPRWSLYASAFFSLVGAVLALTIYFARSEEVREASARYLRRMAKSVFRRRLQQPGDGPDINRIWGGGA